MIHSNLFLVVIAGGSGTRFWPKSTSKRPKQLLSFFNSALGSDSGDSTLLGKTLSRFDRLVSDERKWIVTTQSLKNTIEAEGIHARVLAEPQGRNTAPCVYWAAREVARQNPSAVMMVMPADHFISQEELFISTVSRAVEWAATKNDLVTLGIQPSRPETGYGYLKTADLAGNTSTTDAPKKVEAFVEKPNLELAERFLKSSQYLWNGGMFLWRAEVILEAFDQYMPEMKQAWESAGGRIDEAYPKMTATSIDYGNMEKAKNVVTFPLDCGWDDVGSWTSLESLAPQLGASQNGNTVTSGKVIALDSNGNIVDVPNRTISLLGVQDLIVVEHGEVLLVAKKDRAQDIKKMVEEVRKTRADLI